MPVHPSPLRPERVAATPMAFVRAIVLGYEKYGVDPSAALRQAQITPELLWLPNGRMAANGQRGQPHLPATALPLNVNGDYGTCPAVSMDEISISISATLSGASPPSGRCESRRDGCGPRSS